jgi:nicotinamide-nucleotide amidase
MTNSGVVIKTFGISEEQVLSLIKDFSKYKTITITLEPSVLEVTIYVSYSNKVTKNNVDYVLGGIFERLKEHIYADFETTLSKLVLENLISQKKMLAVAESITGGKIASDIVLNGGASKALCEGIVAYSNGAKINRLNVNPATLIEFGAVSVETAYEMAAGLLETSKADVVAATTGFAEMTESGKPAGLTYIAVGDISGIHVYKHSFSGDRLTVIESAVKTAFYYILKLLNNQLV